MKCAEIKDLGLLEYQKALDLQKKVLQIKKES